MPSTIDCPAQPAKGGAHSFLFGGVDQHLLRECPCPVWIMVGETSANYQRIFAAVDSILGTKVMLRTMSRER